MEDESDQIRYFNEKEMSAVLKRAAELQGNEGTPASIGLSLVELQQVASDTGIDPRYVSRAVAELDVSGRQDKTNIWGGPLTMTLERVVEGDEGGAKWEEMLPDIRRTFGEIGVVQERGSSKEWARSVNRPGMQQAHVILTPRNGQTRIEVFWSEPVLAAPMFAVAVVLGMIMLPVIFESLAMTSMAGVVVYLAVLGTLFLAVRWLLSRVAGKKKREIRRLMAHLEEIVGADQTSPENPVQTADLGKKATAAGSLIIDADPSTTESAREARGQKARA